MSKMKNWMVALALVSLLAVGVVALAGNGFGTTTGFNTPLATGTCACDQDDDGDGIPNSEDPDWVRPLDGSGYGTGYGTGYGMGLSADRPLDGTGYGAQGGNGMNNGSGTCGGNCDGSCL